LNDIGRIYPNDWVWNGHGFYDNNPGSWSSFNCTEIVDYQVLQKRMKVSADENASYQPASKLSSS
jgi:carbonic anhydrase